MPLTYWRDAAVHGARNNACSHSHFPVVLSSLFSCSYLWQGVFVKGLEWFVVTSPEDTDALMRRGFNRRMVGSTEMNASSSRSHTIFTVIVQASTDDDVEGDGTGTVRNGKLNLVDLAGSERQSKTVSFFFFRSIV